MAVAVRLLGRFAVTVDGAVVSDGAWQTRRARQLVAFLAPAADRRALSSR